MSQRSPFSESANTGLPDEATYNPEAIGTAALEAGEPEQVFSEFGLELVPVLMDGEDTGRRLLRRNGEYLSSVSSDYRLVPNERVVEAADAVAEELGAVPFNEFSGDWYVPLDGHVFQDAERRRVHALYAWDSSDLGGGEDIEYGFGVHNSIDSSQAFSVGLFTFRHACANMVLMGVNKKGMSFDDREVLAHSSHKHTKGLDPAMDHLSDLVKTTLMFVDDIDETYRQWRDQFVTVGDVAGLIDRFPDSDLPEWIQDIAEDLEAAEENESPDGEGVLTSDRRDSIIRDGLPASETVWSTYNDITESVWHSSNQDTTKQRKFKKLHRVFPPAQGIR